MAFFFWNDSMCVNVPELDRHHRKLVSLINELHNGVEGNATPETLRQRVDAFRDYASVHFEAEESYMRTTGYSGLEAHAREHQEFALSMETWFDRLAEGDTRAGRDALAFLKRWFLDHVQRVDQAYAPPPAKR